MNEVLLTEKNCPLNILSEKLQGSVSKGNLSCLESKANSYSMAFKVEFMKGLSVVEEGSDH